MFDYRNIDSVEQLQTEYGLITEAKKDDVDDSKKDKDGKENEKIKPTLFTKDKLDVQYADLKAVDNIFKHIIVFTNCKDPKGNKTLNNIYEAIDELKKAKCKVIPELHVFVAADVDSTENEEEILIKDDDEEFRIKDENNTDTLVFSRLSVQNEYECEHIVKLFHLKLFFKLPEISVQRLRVVFGNDLSDHRITVTLDERTRALRIRVRETIRIS